MEINKIRELIRMLEDSSLSEMEIEEGEERIMLRKPGPGAAPAPAVVHAIPHLEGGQPPAVASQPAQPAAPSAPSKPAEEEGIITIDSPMVGVFYSAPSPDDPAFVAPGDRVAPSQTVCIVEAMKLMNEVPAKVSGEIVRCLVENGEPVEFGQPLFAVRTDAH